MKNDRIDEQVERWVERYFRKVAPRAGTRLSSPEGRERVRAAFAHQAEVISRTRGVLSQWADPVSVMDYPRYMCFNSRWMKVTHFLPGRPTDSMPF